MATSRTNAINAIIKLSLERQEISLDDVSEKLDGDSSNRTIRRAMGDAQEYGWVEKQGKNGHAWTPGPTAKDYRIGKKSYGYPTGDLPIMYYVSSKKTAHPFLYGESVLVSAGQAWREGGTGFSLAIPDAAHLMIDSGGYQAALYFGDEYPYSPKQLNTWADNVRADVVWGMDWACEDSEVLASNAGIDKDSVLPWERRFEKSYTEQLKHFEDHQQGRYSHEFRPVIQGHDPDDFVTFARRVDDGPMPTEHIGIGTVCKRSDNDTIYEVVKSVESILPDAKIHLFGATLNIWNDERFDGLFHSSDSAAWIRHDPKSGMYPGGNDGYERAYNAYKEKVEQSSINR